MAAPHVGVTWTPWYIIPANQRWCTYAAVASILVERFQSLHSAYPTLSAEERDLLEHARAVLEEDNH